jgi:four helix bundle protein
MQLQGASEEQIAWEKVCPPAITSDVIWKLDVYRAALFLLHVARIDGRALTAAWPADHVGLQLTSAAGSISSNLGEGYSRSTRPDRLRFLDYALGSARECIVWYQAARGVLPDDVIEQRLVLVARIRSLLLGLIRSTRERNPKRTRFEP